MFGGPLQPPFLASGALAPLAAVLSRLRARLEPGAGVLAEAAIVVVGAKFALRQAQDERSNVGLEGRRDLSGWRVLLLRGGEELAVLAAADARALGRDMVRLAAAIEGKVP